MNHSSLPVRLSRWSRQPAVLAMFAIAFSSGAVSARVDADCSQFERGSPSASLQNVKRELAETNEAISNLEGVIRKGMYIYDFMGLQAYPIDAPIRVLLSRYAKGEVDAQKFEAQLISIIRQIATQRQQAQQSLADLRDKRELLNRCQLEFSSVASRKPRGTIRTLHLSTETADSEDLYPSEGQHWRITKNLFSVETTLNSEKCYLNYAFEVRGMPDKLQPGQLFAVQVSGRASGQCRTAGGSYGGVLLTPGSGLERLAGPAQNNVKVGVPDTGKAPRPGQIPSRTETFRFKVKDNAKAATMEFRVGHGSGTKLVTRYTWN